MKAMLKIAAAVALSALLWSCSSTDDRGVTISNTLFGAAEVNSATLC